MRGAAHRVPDPAARASAPATPHASRWFCGTRAVPGCECGAGRGRWLSAPGGSRCLVGSPDLTSPCLAELCLSSCLLACLSPPFPSLCQCHSLQVSGALSLSLCFSDSAVSVSVLPSLPRCHCVSFCPSFFLTSLSLVQCHCPCAPCAPCPLNPPHLCFWRGGGYQHLTTGAVAILLHGSAWLG